jgi:hypothetical protein
VILADFYFSFFIGEFLQNFYEFLKIFSRFFSYFCQKSVLKDVDRIEQKQRTDDTKKRRDEDSDKTVRINLYRKNMS